MIRRLIDSLCRLAMQAASLYWSAKLSLAA